MRTPLSVIPGYSEQIEQNIDLLKKIREKALNIKSQVVRLRNLVNDLNLATRLNSEGMTLEQERFCPAGFCRNFLADFINDVSNENYPVEIDINNETNALLISGIPDLLRRAFYNLLSNSIRHNPEGCTIYFQSRKVNDQVVFEFSDDGKGITAEHFEEIRNRREIYSDTKFALPPQHGLGLYAVQQIIKLHHASISFYNGEKKGFPITITIPVIKKYLNLSS